MTDTTYLTNPKLIFDAFWNKISKETDPSAKALIEKEFMAVVNTFDQMLVMMRDRCLTSKKDQDDQIKKKD